MIFLKRLWLMPCAFTGAKTEHKAVVKALDGFNRSQRLKDLLASFGTLDCTSNDEIETGDLEEIARRARGTGAMTWSVWVELFQGAKGRTRKKISKLGED